MLPSAEIAVRIPVCDNGVNTARENGFEETSVVRRVVLTVVARRLNTEFGTPRHASFVCNLIFLDVKMMLPRSQPSVARPLNKEAKRQEEWKRCREPTFLKVPFSPRTQYRNCLSVGFITDALSVANLPSE